MHLSLRVIWQLLKKSNVIFEEQQYTHTSFVEAFNKELIGVKPKNKIKFY